ncbi:MAG TPA: hypothetical protein V6C65_04510 [Allocoleopsis sp.]
MSNRKRSGKLIYRPKPARIQSGGGAISFPSSLTTPSIWIDLSQQLGLTNGANASNLTNFGTYGGLTASVPATFISDGKNGKPILRSTSNGTAKSTYYFGTGQPNDRVYMGYPAFIAWMVIKPISIEDANRVWVDAYNTFQLGCRYTTSNYFYIYTNPIYLPTTTPLSPDLASGWGIYMFYASTDKICKIYFNGLPMVTPTSFDAGRFPLILNVSGEFAESGFIDSSVAISSAQINELGNYLSQKWGISWSAI